MQRGRRMDDDCIVQINEPECCICKVPPPLNGSNEDAYQPKIISIGPYHHEKDYCNMEEEKWRYLRAHIARAGNDYDQGFQKYKDVIGHMEGKIRACYLDAVSYNPEQLTEIMVLDACFLIELFTRYYISIENNIPDLILSRLYTLFLKDFLQLENQIPFFVLETIFNLSPVGGITMQTLALMFFCKHEVVYSVCYKPKHLLHLLHDVLVHPMKNRRLPGECKKLIPPVSKLDALGVQISPVDHRCKTYLDIQFKNYVLEIPRLPVDTLNASIVRNCVAFENCFNGCSYFIHYVSFIASLVRTSEDVATLSTKNIVDNSHGSYEEIVSLFNDVNSQVCHDGKLSYLFDVINDVNDFAESKFYRHIWVKFKQMCLCSPRIFIGASVTAILLVAGVVQTAYTVLGHLDEKSFITIKI